MSRVYAIYIHHLYTAARKFMHLEAILVVLLTWVMGRYYIRRRWRSQNKQRDAGPDARILSLKDISASEDGSEICFDPDYMEAADIGEQAIDEIPGLSYWIPKSVMEALQRAKNTKNGKGKAVYWSHDFYQNANRQSVKVFYASTLQESEILAKRFLNTPVLGFDMEWEFDVRKPGKTYHSIQENISLIQLASESEIGLFHIGLHKGNTVDKLLAPSLRAVLEDKNIAKCGVNVIGDYNRLEKYMDVKKHGLFELSRLYRMVKYAATDPEAACSWAKTGLSAQVEEHLGFPLFKGDVRTSRWSEPLDQAQRTYAASDAYAGYVLYRVMNAKRLKMDPIPPLPAFVEMNIRSVISYDELVDEEEEDEEDEPEVEDEDEMEALQESGTPGGKARKSSTLVKTSAKKRRSRKSITVSDGHEDLDSLGRAIYDALWMNRAHSARREGVTPFIIAPNSIFVDIAISRPTDLQGLHQIKGIGPAKLRKYGDQWLDIITKQVALHTLLNQSQPRADSFTTSAMSPARQPQGKEFRMPPPMPVFPHTPGRASPKAPRPSLAGSMSSSPAFEPQNTLPSTQRSVSAPQASSSQASEPNHNTPASDRQVTRPPLEHHASCRCLHCALLALRWDLSAIAGKENVEDVVSDEILAALAARKPTTIGEICKTPGAGFLLMTAKGQNRDLLQIIQTHSANAIECTSQMQRSPEISPARTPLAERPGLPNAKAKRTESFTAQFSAKKPRNFLFSEEELIAFVDDEDFILVDNGIEAF